MRTTPVEVHLREKESRLDIHWSDGHVTRFSLAYLRGWCPCARCQGHFVLQKKFITGVSTRLLDLQPIGGYAMRPVWSDGHDSGMYAFDYLRELEQAPPGEGPTNAELLGT